MIKLKRLLDNLLLSQAAVNSNLLTLFLAWEAWGLGRVPWLSLCDLLSKRTEAALNGRGINSRMETQCNRNAINLVLND